jgi:hypothetical protein
MKTGVKLGKNSIIFLSALLALTGGWLAWHRHQANNELLAGLLITNKDSGWQKRAPAPARKISDSPVPLQASPAQAGPAPGEGMNQAEAKNAAAENAGGEGAERAADGPGKDPAETPVAMMKALEGYYAGLFRRLNLTPDQAAQFNSLHSAALANAMGALSPEEQNQLGTNPSAFAQLLANVEAGLDPQMLAQFGDAVYAQYKVEQQTFTQRTTIERLEQSLSASPTPLTDDQASQMVQILARTEEQGPGPKTIYSRISAQTLALATGLLSEPQLQALQQLQQQQGGGN